MTAPTPDNLGTVVTSNLARRIIYGTYVILLIGAGAAQVGFSSVQLAQPHWLTAALAVLVYLGIPVGGLAFVNATAKAPPPK